MPRAKRYRMFANYKIGPFPDPHPLFGKNPVETERGLDALKTVGDGRRKGVKIGRGDWIDLRNLHYAIELDLLGLADFEGGIPSDATPALYAEVEEAMQEAVRRGLYGPLIRLRRPGALATVVQTP